MFFSLGLYAHVSYCDLLSFEMDHSTELKIEPSTPEKSFEVAPLDV
jgi:hypothetical protein